MTVSPGQVAAVVRREFPDADVRDVRDVSSGLKATFLVSLRDRDVVVSLHDGALAREQFAVEPGVMGLVARETTIPVPRVLAAAVDPPAEPPYFVTERMPGGPLDDVYSSFDADARQALVFEAGRRLGELHRRVPFDAPGRLRFDAERASVVVDPAASWPRLLDDLLSGWIARLGEGRFSDLAATFERVRPSVSDVDEDVPATDPASSLLHFDYRPANLLVEDREITAVLDWGLALSGHHEYDFFKAEKNFLRAHVANEAVRAELRPHLYRGYRTEHDLGPGWRRRRTRYRVAHTLESMQSFPRWTAALTPGKRDAKAEQLRTELATFLDRL